MEDLVSEVEFLHVNSLKVCCRRNESYVHAQTPFEMLKSREIQVSSPHSPDTASTVYLLGPGQMQKDGGNNPKVNQSRRDSRRTETQFVCHRMEIPPAGCPQTLHLWPSNLFFSLSLPFFSDTFVPKNFQEAELVLESSTVHLGSHWPPGGSLNLTNKNKIKLKISFLVTLSTFYMPCCYI
ncbi:hypothetical protein H1C71_038120 [Ictidomys tridecemlineatus]|nr:hypothetical protein H1C71_038120 [Ictidomys tridecemlineatus]